MINISRLKGVRKSFTQLEKKHGKILKLKEKQNNKVPVSQEFLTGKATKNPYKTSNFNFLKQCNRMSK